MHGQHETYFGACRDGMNENGRLLLDEKTIYAKMKIETFGLLTALTGHRSSDCPARCSLLFTEKENVR